MTDNIIGFPNASHRNRTLRRARAQNGQNMHTLLFRSRELILQSDEADLVRGRSLRHRQGSEEIGENPRTLAEPAGILSR
jgi:hypothetical protein